MEQQLELSLTHLGVESIDLYQFHTVNDYESLEVVLDPGRPMAILQEAKANGRKKHIGITSPTVYSVLEANGIFFTNLNRTETPRAQT